MVTSLLRGDHQGLGRFAPAFARLSRDAEHVDRLWLQGRDGVLARAGVQHVHRGRVAIGGVEAVRDLIGWKENGASIDPNRLAEATRSIAKVALASQLTLSQEQ